MQGTRLRLRDEWLVGARIGGGGFGQVWEVSKADREAAAKFVPKQPGADRELLFVDLTDVRNVVPIIDFGDDDRHWIIVMPRAERSLRDRLGAAGETLSRAEVTDVLVDVCDALSDLEGRVVHRDLKPENVLRLDHKWCLADFGISRYAEATTAPDTQKFALSPPYAAPERWRNERATSATDVYSLGAMAHELVAGTPPFPGPTLGQFRDQHLHEAPPDLPEAPEPLGTLVMEALHKAPEARPRPANFRARLDRSAEPPASGGLAELQRASRTEVEHRAEAARVASQAQSEADRRQALATSAAHAFDRVSATVRDAIAAAAPVGDLAAASGPEWRVRLGRAQLHMSGLSRHAQQKRWGSWPAPKFDVVASASITLQLSADHGSYRGRAHSLWFGDIQTAGDFGWYETAFMFNPVIRRTATLVPFALDPGQEAAKAVDAAMAEYQVAWPFTPLAVDEVQDFVDRWAGWFAMASGGQLAHPSRLPEGDPQGSWRR